MKKSATFSGSISCTCALDCVPGNGPPYGSVTGSLVGSVIVPAQIVFQLELPLCACASRDCAPPIVPARVLARLLPRQNAANTGTDTAP